VQVRVNPSAVYAELEDGAIVLNVDTGTYFGLDSVGSRIWALVGDGSTQSAIVTQLETEYAAERPQLDADVTDYLRSLEANGLIHVA
jgi:Coenzyme PQQ synthesis protein D (PqqD)